MSEQVSAQKVVVGEESGDVERMTKITETDGWEDTPYMKTLTAMKSCLQRVKLELVVRWT